MGKPGYDELLTELLAERQPVQAVAPSVAQPAAPALAARPEAPARPMNLDGMAPAPAWSTGRRSPRHKPAPTPSTYERAGTTAALAAAAAFFALLWLVDAAFTAMALLALGAPLLVALGVHVIISLVQGHLWRAGRHWYWLVIPATLVNVSTSAVGVTAVGAAFGLLSWEGELVQHIIVVSVATGIAALPERMLVAALADMRHLWR